MECNCYFYHFNYFNIIVSMKGIIFQNDYLMHNFIPCQIRMMLPPPPYPKLFVDQINFVIGEWL